MHKRRLFANRYVAVGLIVTVYSFGGFTVANAYTPGKFYYQKKTKEKIIALTFDDGPGPWTPKFLELLARHKIRATFFMEGSQVSAYPAIAKQVVDAGHEVGNHSYNHSNFNLVKNADPVKLLDELARTEAALQKAAGIQTKVVRLPYGALGKNNNKWMLSTLKTHGYALVHWSYGTDWFLKMTADEMAKGYIAHAGPGAVFLFHDGGRKRDKTYDAVVQVLDTLEAKGYHFVAADTLFAE